MSLHTRALGGTRPSRLHDSGCAVTKLYARAYNQSPEAVEFYEFTRTMQSYKSIISENTTLVLSTDSDLLRFLKGMTPEGMTPEGKVTSTRSTGNIGPGRTPGTDERTQDAKEN